MYAQYNCCVAMIFNNGDMDDKLVQCYVDVIAYP